MELMTATTARHDPKNLYRRLDALLVSVHRGAERAHLVEAFVTPFFEAFREDLRLRAAVLLAETRGGLERVLSVGDDRDLIPPDVLPAPAAFAGEEHVFIAPDPARLGLSLSGPAAGLSIAD